MTVTDKKLDICKDSKFVCHLEKATETVRSWPKWKQDILGDSTPTQKIDSSEPKKVKIKCS